MNKKSMYRKTVIAMVTAMVMSSASVYASESDDRISTALKESYVFNNYLQDDSIKTDVKDGVVTLTGTVSQESHRTLAEDTAENVKDVVHVNNQLATEAEVAAENADTRIARNIKLSLLFHRHVNSGETTVESKDGMVTLTGTASSEAQKELTAEYAKDIEGVIEVNNQMTILAAPEMAERTEGKKMDDASVTAQVKSSLLTHRSTSSISTKVTTRDGEVTLTGIAKNDAEKSLVSKLVKYINGVTSVKNEMTVEAPKTI